MTERLEQAIQEIELGNKQAAIKLLAQVLKENPNNEDAWIWMSEAVDDSIKKVECLEKVIEINPFNQDALRGLEHLRGQAIFMRSDPFPFASGEDDDEEEADAVEESYAFGELSYSERWEAGLGEAAPVEPVDWTKDENGEAEEPAPAAELTDEEAPLDIDAMREQFAPVVPLTAGATAQKPPARRDRTRTVFSRKQFIILGVMAAFLLLIACGGGAFVIVNILRGL